MATHWGTYRHAGPDGLTPLADDPDPTRFGLELPAERLAPCRILRPAVRRSFLEHGAAAWVGRRGADPFVEVTWEDALDLAASEIRRVRDEHGPGALYSGSYGWSSAGRFHHAQSQLKRFYNLAGGSVRSVQSYSYAAGEVLLPHVLGSTAGLVSGHTAWDQLAGHATLIVMFGGTPLRNAQVSAGGIAGHGTRDGLLACRDGGARFVNVSPVCDDAAAALGADWLALRPNTDAALMLALCRVLVAEGLHDPAFLASHTVGFEVFADYLAGGPDGVVKDAAWASGITGLDAAAIEGLARRMAAQRTFLMVAWSLQRADHGEQPYWAAIALACLLGGIGLPGGGFGFGYASIGGIGVAPPAIAWPALPQGVNPVAAAIPVARIADMLLDPGGAYDHDGARRRYPDVKLIHWAGGNPFHHHQDLNRLVEAWQRPQTIIVHEHWWNAHARHADIVLPAATFLERDDVAASNRDHFIAYSARMAEPPEGVMTDHDILCRLADRLGFAAAFTEGLATEGWLRRLYAAARDAARAKAIALPPFETFRDRGLVSLPIPAVTTPFLSDFRADPARHPLRTPSGRIELFSGRIAGFGYADCPGHPVWLEPREWLGAPAAARYPLHLLSPQPHDKLHSQWDHAAPARRTKAGGHQPVLVHPSDLAARRIADGDTVEVESPRGRCLATARATDGLRPGVVQIATGAWFDPSDPSRPASLERNGNPNVLTPDHGTSRLAQGPSPNSCLVDIRRFAAADLGVGCYGTPAFDVGADDTRPVATPHPTPLP